MAGTRGDCCNVRGTCDRRRYPNDDERVLLAATEDGRLSTDGRGVKRAECRRWMRERVNRLCLLDMRRRERAKGNLRWMISRRGTVAMFRQCCRCRGCDLIAEQVVCALPWDEKPHRLDESSHSFAAQSASPTEDTASKTAPIILMRKVKRPRRIFMMHAALSNLVMCLSQLMNVFDEKHHAAKLRAQQNRHVCDLSAVGELIVLMLETSPHTPSHRTGEGIHRPANICLLHLCFLLRSVDKRYASITTLSR